MKARWNLVLAGLSLIGFSGCADKGGPVNITFRINNQATDCTENTLYYKCTWNTQTGTDETLTTSVGPGGVSTQFIAAYDSADDGNSRADEFGFQSSVFDPDPAFGCGTSDAGYTNTLKEGDMLVITVDQDGGHFTEEIVPARNSSLLDYFFAKATTSARSVVRKKLPPPVLKPIPDHTVPAAK